tara:strand:- start:728 stop:1741 length:1014 start_codon:yes stop_codon:yes gene_type:complete
MAYLFSVLSFIILLLIFKNFAYTLNLIDKPNYRKKHKGDIPLIGGIIIYSNILIFSFNFNTSNIMTTILLTSIILIILGALDDAIELGVIFRLLTQLICCLILIGSGLVIYNIGDYMYLPNIQIGILSVLFTVFCVIGLTNSFNFIDGVDGLCGGLALISIISVLIISYLNDKLIYLLDFEFLILVSITLILFIIFNLTNYYKIFLGDSGSMFLGFFVSWILIMTSQSEEQIIHPILTIWSVTLPIFDITSVVIRRSLRRINPFKPDRRHVHHILIELGFSDISTTAIILLLSIILNFFGILIFYLSGPLPALVSFIVLLFLYVILMINLSRKANTI